MSRKKDRLRSSIENAPAVAPKSGYVAAARSIKGFKDFRPQDIRIVKFPSIQASVFLNYGDDLISAGESARPPFAYTFYDFGFLDVGVGDLVGAAVFCEDENWAAAMLLRIAKRNWVSVILEAAQLSSMRRRVFYGGLSYRVSDDLIRSCTLLIAGALVFLESANVDLVDAVPLPKGHQAFGIPHFEVVVRQSQRRLVYQDGYQPAEIARSHRWEVRGHFKHFRRGSTFDKNVDHRVRTADGDEFVRIWCPPHVKGPEDKPLVPKIRRVVV